MKEIFLFVALAATILMSGCEKEKKVVNLTDTVKADYEALVAAHQNDTIVLYEVEAVLDGNVSDRKPVGLVSYKEVFQADSIVYFVEHYLANDSVAYDSVKGSWLEDLAFSTDTICDLDVALDCLYKADIVLPESNLFTLRKPLYKVIYNPLYIFGSTETGFVAVDGVTQEVSEVE